MCRYHYNYKTTGSKYVTKMFTIYVQITEFSNRQKFKKMTYNTNGEHQSLEY